MQNQNIEQFISTLIISPTNGILAEISSFFIETQNEDVNILISKYFQSLFNLEHWAWEILSRDSREWHDDDEGEYLKLFSNLSLFNQKIILNNYDIKTKESLLLPTNIDIINRIFQQIDKRTNENDRFLSIINLWFDNLALFTNEHIELTKLSVIIHINERIISDIIMNKQFQIYLEQLKNPSPVITTKQLFYLKTSIFLLNKYLYSQPPSILINSQQIIEYLAQDYTTILLIHSQTIASWSDELLACITHLIGLISTCHGLLDLNNEILQMFIIPNKSIYDYIESLIDILSYRLYNKEIHMELLNNILELFLYLINFQEIKYHLKSQKKLLNTFLIFNDMSNHRIGLLTYYLQSEILSEKELKQLNIVNNMTEKCFYYLQQTWKNPLKKYNKISIEELLKYLLNLSKINIIKNAIVKLNQLKFLIELSNKYSIVYEILFSLSFDVRIQKQLHSNQTFINTLEITSINQQIIQGIKWNLNLPNVKTNNPIEEKFDIIISYAPEDRLISTQINNELIEHDYHVSIDLNDSKFDRMVQTIEQSRIIILCMSEKYGKNNFCRIQAEYAFRKQLKILPILIEKFYQIDGWLSFLIGNLFSIDFTKNQFSQSIKILLNELQNPHISVLDSLVVRQQPQNLVNSCVISKPIQQWTQIDVQQWLNDNNLLHMGDLLSELNGLSLIYLSELISKNSPQENLFLFQQDSLNRTGKNISLIEIAKLHDLIEHQIKIPIKAKKIRSNYCCYMM